MIELDYEPATIDDLIFMRIALNSIKPQIDRVDILRKVIKEEKFNDDVFKYNPDLMDLVAKGFDADLRGLRPDFEKLFHYIKLSYCMKFNEQDLKIYQKLYDEKMANLNGKNEASGDAILRSTSSGRLTKKSFLFKGAEETDPYFRNGIWIAERFCGVDAKELYWVVTTSYISEKAPNGKVKDGSFGFDLYFTDGKKNLILLVSSPMPYSKLHYKKFLKPKELPV